LQQTRTALLALKSPFEDVCGSTILFAFPELAELRQRLGAAVEEPWASPLAKRSMGWEAWAKRASESNIPGAMRATTRRCFSSAHGLRPTCAPTSPGSVIHWSLTSRNRGTDSARGSRACERRIPLAGRESRLAPILDNADTQEAASGVEETLPRLQGGQLIITSRIADWSASVQPVELDVLAEEDAAAFLLERTESRRARILTDSQDAAAVAHDLGGLAFGKG